MTTVDEVAADLAEFKTQVPTLEEQLFSLLVPCWNNGADKLTNANAMTFLVAPFPLRVLSIALSWDYWSLPANDSNYWSLTARRGSNPSGWVVVATRTTQSTGGNANGGVTARKAWSFDAAAWASADLLAGDLLRVDFTPVGAVADLDMPFTVTVRYRPL